MVFTVAKVVFYARTPYKRYPPVNQEQLAVVDPREAMPVGAADGRVPHDILAGEQRYGLWITSCTPLSTRRLYMRRTRRLRGAPPMASTMMRTAMPVRAFAHSRFGEGVTHRARLVAKLDDVQRVLGRFYGREDAREEIGAVYQHFDTGRRGWAQGQRHVLRRDGRLLDQAEKTGHKVGSGLQPHACRRMQSHDLISLRP